MISLFILLPLYCIGVQYERGGWWRLCLIVAIPTLVLDWLLNYTTWVPLWGMPGKGEYTITKRLTALKPSDTWKGAVARYVCRVLDAIAPSGCHCHE